MLTGMIALLLMAQTPTPAPTPAPTPTPTVTVGPPISSVPHAPVVKRGGDATVLGAIGAADANEIEVSKLATTKASDGAVKAYAVMTLRDHEKSLTAGAHLAKELHITRLLPNDSAMARMQKQTMIDLNLLTGAAFDQAFVRYTVEAHKALLAKDRGKLQSEMARRRVKEFLRNRQPVLEMHLAVGEKWLAAHP